MASLQEFFDPFYQQPPNHVSEQHHECLSLPKKWATAEEGVIENPTLKIDGQGIIAIKAETAEDLIDIKVKSKEEGNPYIHLQIAPYQCFLTYNRGGKEYTFDPEPVVRKSKEWCWLEPPQTRITDPDAERTYWLSIDRDRGTLRYGKYFFITSHIGLEVNLKQLNPKNPRDNKTMEWINAVRDSWLVTVKDIEITVDKQRVTDMSNIQISDVPVVLDLSPIITTSDDITLEELETALETVPANLPDACQRLYNNIAGKNVTLNTKEYPELARAIQYSCETEGCWAHDTLVKKATEFGADPLQTYLRITLGYNQGNSPGVPYVLEIWPSGHYSPIHDHGDACAIIKLLYGQIQATYFDSLIHQRPLGPPLGLIEGQITWLGEENYQIHKLENVSNDVCCTIQCYSYEKNRNKHEDVFHWSKNGVPEPWTPTSDSTFSAFRDQVMREWADRPLRAVWKLVEREKEP